MNGLGFWGIAAAGTAMAVWGGLQFASLGEPPFAYDSASNDSRTVFLQTEAAAFEKRLQRSLQNNSGVGAKFKVSGTKAEPIARRLTVQVDVSGYYNKKGFDQNRRKLQSALLKTHCKSFANGRLAKNRVAIQIRFIGTKKQKRMATINMNTASCKPYLSV